MKIADGIHRLGSGMINAYLLVDGGGVTVIDTGLPGHWSDLTAELETMGRSLEDVQAVVLTHGHSDHLGFAERTRRERGVAVLVHDLDSALARGKVRNPARGTGPVRPLPLLRFIVFAMLKRGWQIDRLGAVTTFGDGATLDVPGSPRVILVPGHTPGSVALHVPSHDAIFMGDTMSTLAVTTGRTGPMIAPFTADPAQALSSLDRLADIEATWVLPGHGQPWTGGLGEAIRLTRAGAASGS